MSMGWRKNEGRHENWGEERHSCWGIDAPGHLLPEVEQQVRLHDHKSYYNRKIAVHPGHSVIAVNLLKLDNGVN